MASPTVVSRTNNAESTNTTTHTCNLPASLVAGNLLLLFCAVSGTPGTMAASGYTLLGTVDANGTSALAIFYKTSDGTEGASATVTTTNSIKLACASYQISGWSGTPEKGTASTGASGAADPPNLAPSGGSKDYLFFAIGSYVSVSTANTGAPTNYSNGQFPITSGSKGSLSAAERQLTASSDNPGAFTGGSNSNAWVGQTVAISPVGAASANYGFNMPMLGM